MTNYGGLAPNEFPISLFICLVNFGYLQVHIASLIPHLLIDFTAKTMIRLTGLSNWSESSLAKNNSLWFSYNVT